MDFESIGKAFVIGLVGNFTLGPLFMLTFDRAARFGFRRGFASAFAVAVADALLFSIGLMGGLSLMLNIKAAKDTLNLFGALFLFLFGIHSFVKAKYENKATFLVEKFSSQSFAATFGKAFVMTVANPLTIAYFTAVSVGLLGGIDEQLFAQTIIVLSGMVALGTLVVLSIVSFTASRIGHAIAPKKLAFVNYITAVIFIAFGGYLFFIFLSQLSTLNSFF